MKKKKLWTAVLAVALLAVVCFLVTHSFIDGKIYAKYGDVLDLRGSGISIGHYDLVREEFPDREILWDVPFQGGFLAHDSTSVTVSALTDADVSAMGYLEDLELVDARGCRDYAQLTELIMQCPEAEVLYTVSIDGVEYSQDAETLQFTNFTAEELELMQYLPEVESVQAEDCREYDLLMQLRERYPDMEVSYEVTIGDGQYPEDTAQLELIEVNSRELMDMLKYLPRLERVSVVNPDCAEVTMPQLTEAYPNIDFYWEKEILGVTITSEDTQLSYIPKDIDEVSVLEQELKNFHDLERVYLGYCELDNEELAAYRDRVRQEYKVVWNILIGAEYIDTDATWFMPGKTGRGLMEHQAVLLKYCEDMVCIDIGHKLVETCDFVRYMPNLKYLILACTNVKDITPISTCQNLIYLELQVSKVEDYSPLLECKALQDLNLSMTFGDPEPVYQITWLKRLHWINHEHLREEFEKALPNTELMLANEWVSVGQGWRDHQNYYDMRDILGMYYMPSSDA